MISFFYVCEQKMDCSNFWCFSCSRFFINLKYLRFDMKLLKRIDIIIEFFVDYS